VKESNFSVSGFISTLNTNYSSVNIKEVGQMLCAQLFVPNESACYKECLSHVRSTNTAKASVQLFDLTRHL